MNPERPVEADTAWPTWAVRPLPALPGASALDLPGPAICRRREPPAPWHGDLSSFDFCEPTCAT